MKKIVFSVCAFLAVALCAFSAFALSGDGGTIAACYPGGFNQVLLGVKPFVVPCVQFKIIGTCKAAKLVEFWLPTYAIEVTGQANTTVFPASLADVVSSSLPMGGSMVQGEAGNDTQTKYREAHIYQLSTSDVATILSGHPSMPCMLTAASSITGSTVFKSELYPGWRLGKDPTGAPDPLAFPVGSWGPLYPRTGWSNHPSNITNSLLLSYRAQQLGAEFSLLLGGTLNIDKYEIGGPIPGACYPIGNPTMLQEINSNRPLCADRVVTIFWRHVITCCPF